MNLRTFQMAVILFLALVLALPQGSSAEAVGRLTEVQGRVDLLKGGKLPATPVKVGDAVEPGDVLRAKSMSKAQITFQDNTTLTMSPESRISIDEYMFDPAKKKRSVLLEVFYGSVLAVVSKIYQTEQPDFVIKSHTAIMGIRGTEVGVRLTPNDTTILNHHGWTTVANVFPEVEDSVSKKAKKIAYSFPPSAIDLKDKEGAVVGWMTRPEKFDVTNDQWNSFNKGMNIVSSVKPQAQGAVCSAGSPGASSCAPGAMVASEASAATSAVTSSGAGLGSSGTGSAAGSGTPGGGISIVATLPQQAQVAPPTLQTFSFTLQQFYVSYIKNSANPFNVATYNGSSGTSVFNTITAVSPATSIPITAVSFNITATATNGLFSAGSSGLLFFSSISSSTNPVTLSGQLGGALTGNMQLNGWQVENVGDRPSVPANFNLNGTATLQNNTLTYETAGTFTVTGASGNITGGTITETLTPQASTSLSSTSLSSTALSSTSLSSTALSSTSLSSTSLSSTPQASTSLSSTAQVAPLRIVTEQVAALQR